MGFFIFDGELNQDMVIKAQKYIKIEIATPYESDTGIYTGPDDIFGPANEAEKDWKETAIFLKRTAREYKGCIEQLENEKAELKETVKEFIRSEKQMQVLLDELRKIDPYI